jgi:hypothetical protein
MAARLRLVPFSLALRRMTRSTAGGTPRNVIGFTIESYHASQCIINDAPHYLCARTRPHAGTERSRLDSDLVSRKSFF